MRLRGGTRIERLGICSGVSVGNVGTWQRLEPKELRFSWALWVGLLLNNPKLTAHRRVEPTGCDIDVLAHKTRAVFDRYNIVNEQELLQAGERLVSYLDRGMPPRVPRA